jgi:hypothetical protein
VFKKEKPAGTAYQADYSNGLRGSPYTLCEYDKALADNSQLIQPNFAIFHNPSKDFKSKAQERLRPFIFTNMWTQPVRFVSLSDPISS